MTAGEAIGRLRLWTVIVLLGTFVAGAVAGVGASRWLGAPPFGPPPLPPPLPALLGEVGLTPEQAAKAHAIVERYRPELDAILAETFPKVRAVNERMEAALREILDPAQRARLDEVKARRPPPLPGAPFPPGPPPPGPAGAPFPPGPPPPGR